MKGTHDHLIPVIQDRQTQLGVKIRIIVKKMVAKRLGAIAWSDVGSTRDHGGQLNQRLELEKYIVNQILELRTARQSSAWNEVAEQIAKDTVNAVVDCASPTNQGQAGHALIVASIVGESVGHCRSSQKLAAD